MPGRSAVTAGRGGCGPRTARPDPVPDPESVALGEPAAGYPVPWSVQTWIPGTVAPDADPGTSAGFAADPAEFIAGVREIGTRDRTFAGSAGAGTCAATTRG
jgi:aminoglycoside phosphotransferase (APT) family kinase protein